MAGTIRFYKYFFTGVKQPVIMEAENRDAADRMLDMLGEKSKTRIDMSKLEDLRIESPLLGVSTKKRDGKVYIWVGPNKSADGWMLKSEFETFAK